MMNGGMMGGLMLLWVLFLLVLIALAGAALVWLVRSLREPRGSAEHRPADSPARSELDRRYAAGELSREEYLERRRDLES